MVKKYGRVFKVHGMLLDEQIYVTDPRAMHHIIVKDQHVFEETADFIESNKIIFGTGLLSTLGDHHKKQRKLLNPVFSLAHMRDIAPIFYAVTYKLTDALTTLIKESGSSREIDMLQWTSRTALEYIGQAGLGYSFDSFGKTEANPYNRSVKNFVPAASRLRLIRSNLLLPLIQVTTSRFRRILVRYAPFESIQTLRKIVDMMAQTSVEVYESKKVALAAGDEAVAKQIGQGKDIMSVLLKANMSAKEEDRLPEEEIIGQMNTLIFAAHDTTSGALARILHLLALHPVEQAKLRKEVTDARAEHGDVPYDELVRLPYLDAVVRESMRLYAPVNAVHRTTRKDVVLPLGTPIKATDGHTDIHELHLKSNTNVIVGLGASNRDPLIWGDEAHLWKPERWFEKTPDEVAKERLPGVYSGMMTFLGGGRACIGFKFSLLEMKVVLTMLLEYYVFEPAESEIVWMSTGIAVPRVKGKENGPASLPLKVSLVK